MERPISFTSSISDINHEHTTSSEFASFGAIHLNNTSLHKATLFWTKIVSMKLRKASENIAEFGSETQTLVVVHQTAKMPFIKGYSGLYHFAIHAPDKEEFARMIYRLLVNNYPFSPVDHIMSKSVYLDDPDGINIEFTLETPERFRRVISDGGLKIEDADGNIRNATEYLDINGVLDHLIDNDVSKIISNETHIGHMHLYANSVQSSKSFYQKIGFAPSHDFPEFMFADLGLGGAYTHRMALNSWHGINKPLAPKESAGMKYFHLKFKTKEKLNQALKSISVFEKKDSGYWLLDPSGNSILLTSS